MHSYLGIFIPTEHKNVMSPVGTGMLNLLPYGPCLEKSCTQGFQLSKR